MNKKAYVCSLSCPSGHYEAEQIRGLLKSRGWEILGERNIALSKFAFDETVIKKADLIIYNTCSFTEETAADACKVISQIKSLMRDGSKLIVCGCLPKTNPGRLKDVFGGMSFSWGEIDKLKNYLKDKCTDRQIEKLPFSGAKEWNVRICTGCLDNCAYCADKIAIGYVKSRPAEDIIAEVREGLNKGYKEILLSAHDSGAYGYDIGKNLPVLLKAVLKIKGNYRLSIDCLNPQHFKKYLDDLIGIYKDNKFLKYIHPPLQSGSNRILKLMNRNYTAEDFLYCLEKFNKQLPSVRFGTDIIVGFPGETEEDFKETLKIIAKFDFKAINIFAYSARPDTLAVSFPGQVNKKEIQERRRRALALWKKIRLALRQ